MSTNVSKKKREDLLSKIGQIRTFIASAPQDTNTGNLLSYLSELEKDMVLCQDLVQVKMRNFSPF